MSDKSDFLEQLFKQYGIDSESYLKSMNEQFSIMNSIGLGVNSTINAAFEQLRPTVDAAIQHLKTMMPSIDLEYIGLPRIDSSKLVKDFNIDAKLYNIGNQLAANAKWFNDANKSAIEELNRILTLTQSVGWNKIIDDYEKEQKELKAIQETSLTKEENEFIEEVKANPDKYPDEESIIKEAKKRGLGDKVISILKRMFSNLLKIDYINLFIQILLTVLFTTPIQNYAVKIEIKNTFINNYSSKFDRDFIKQLYYRIESNFSFNYYVIANKARVRASYTTKSKIKYWIHRDTPVIVKTTKNKKWCLIEYEAFDEGHQVTRSGWIAKRLLEEIKD